MGENLDLGSRRELFVDNVLVDRLEGGARLRLQEPRPAGVALRFDRPWEGPFSGFATVLRDGGRVRLYYRGWPDSRDHYCAVTCLAESADGKSFHRPALGLHEVAGSRENNVIVTCDEDMYTHNFAPFLDDRPGVPQAERYKALTRNYGLRYKDERDDPMGLLAFVSADGVRWEKLRDAPVVTGGKFDSLNVPFWSEHEGCYLCYLRQSGYGGRSIARSRSEDFVHWTEPVLMDFGESEPEQLYTNATTPYCRAPHIYVALPGRFMEGRQVLDEAEALALGVRPRAKAGAGFWDDCSDAVFLSSRGGNRYDRTFMEAFVRPGPDRCNWTSRCNYPACGVIQTGEKELSIYVERHNAREDKYLERLTLRPDGFASLHAGYAGGEMVTPPFTFAGSRLTLNYATSAAGSLRVELQDAAGRPLPGFGLEECPLIVGDEIERRVEWRGGGDLSAHAGTPVRLRFVLKDADVFALQFGEG